MTQTTADNTTQVSVFDDRNEFAIEDADVDKAFAFLIPIREVYEPEMLQELSKRLPYKVARENQAVLLECAPGGTFLVGMCEPDNFVYVRNVARALNAASNKLIPRLITLQRLDMLLETAYEQAMETALANQDEEQFEDLADHNARRETLHWSNFDITTDTSTTQRERTDADVEIGQGTGLRSAAEKILLEAIKRRASDIHVVPQLEAGYINFRTDGVVYQAIKEIPPSRMDNLANAFSDMAGVNGYEIMHRGLGKEINITIKTTSGKKERMTLRFQGKRSYYGRAVVIRINRAVFRDFEQIGLEPSQTLAIQTALHHRTGVILVTGATGSGKSNTLEAMIRRLEVMHQYRKHLIQIGNPIEFPNQRRTQLPVDGEESWAEALKDSMRMDPDIFSPGEFRDAEEAAIVFQGAATGHLTLTTLHTNNIAQTFSRLDFLKIERDKQAGLIQLIVSQELVPVLCRHCKKPDPRGREITEQLIEVVFPNRRDLKEAVSRAEGQAPFFHAEGCAACDHMGIKGRTCIAEVLPITPDVGRMLRNGSDGEEVVDYAVRNYGVMTLAEAAARKLCRGMISYDHVLHLLLSTHKTAPETETHAWQTTNDSNGEVYEAKPETTVRDTEQVTEDEFIEADIEYPESTAAAA